MGQFLEDDLELLLLLVPFQAWEEVVDPFQALEVVEASQASEVVEEVEVGRLTLVGLGVHLALVAEVGHFQVSRNL